MKTNEQTQTHWRDLIVTRSTRLAHTEISKLENFLNTNGNRHGGCTSVSMADGFLTAMLIGPACIPCNPHQGLEAVWGEMTNDAKAQRVVHASKSKREMVNYLNRLAYRASDALEWNRDSYSPHVDGDVFYGIDFCCDEDAVGSTDGDPLVHESYVPTAIQWCRGFRKFVALTDQAWAPIFETEVSRALIAPFMFFGDEKGWSFEKEWAEGLQFYRESLAQHLKYFVFDVYDFFSPPAWKQVQFALESAEWTIPSRLNAVV